MDLIESLEYNKPIINISIDNIYIKASTNTEASFTIENFGGGILNGEIFCTDKFITVNKKEFNGNYFKITCLFDVDSFSFKDIISTNIKIISNGGDVIIPVKLEKTQMFLETRDDKIYSLQDFLKYYEKNPMECKSLFYSEKFEDFIEKLNGNAKTIYENVKDDINAERAMENFFLMLDLKEQAKVYFVNNSIDIEIAPLNDKEICGVIELKKIGNGYVKSNLKVDCNWLLLNKTVVVSDDFDQYDSCQIGYTIKLDEIKNNLSQSNISINDESKISLKVKKINFAQVSLNKEVFNNKENGYITISNLISKPITFSLKSLNSNIVIDKNTVIVNDKITIPFSIKLTPIEIGRVAILKQPYFLSKIKVVGVVGDNKFSKELPVTIGTKSLELK